MRLVLQLLDPSLFLLNFPVHCFHKGNPKFTSSSNPTENKHTHSNRYQILQVSLYSSLHALYLLIYGLGVVLESLSNSPHSALQASSSLVPIKSGQPGMVELKSAETSSTTAGDSLFSDSKRTQTLSSGLRCWLF